MSKIQLILWSLFIFILSGCSYLSDISSADGNSDSAGYASAAAGDGARDTAPVNSGRMMIWTANYSVEVTEVKKASDELIARMQSLGGFMQDKNDYGEKRQRMVIRVPKDRFQLALTEVEGSGKVLSRRVSGEDVTEQFVDVEARLNSKKALRDRLRALLGKATKIEDIIKIEEELGRIEADIDSMEARMRTMKGQIDLSTITVDLSEKHIKKKTIYGPLGYVYKGAEWFITKLFVIQKGDE
jgi:hypothetical protein